MHPLDGTRMQTERNRKMRNQKRNKMQDGLSRGQEAG